MPRLLTRANGDSPKAAAYNTRRAITASAMKVDLRNRAETQELATQASRSKWQEDAWSCYDGIGEIKFAYGLIASVISRLRLYPAVIVDPEDPPVALTDAATIERPEDESGDEARVQRANDGISPQKALEARNIFRKALAHTSVPDLLRTFALNICVPGECYLMEKDSMWHLKSTDELRIQSDGTPKLYKTRAGTPEDLAKDTPIGRIWRRHPRFSFEPDSAMRALLDDCEELILLSKVIRTNSRARLNAGILYIPDEITVVSQTETDDVETEVEEEDLFEKELYDALTGPVTNEDNPNTVVPLLLRGPGDLGAQIKHITLERKVDESLVARADRVLERILQGLDVPKDIVTGLANVKYSNAIHIDENLYKAHVEPLALIICDAITDIIFRPLLRALDGWTREDAARLVVWYDPSEVVTRPDRAADAQALYDAKELSGSALRAARGFGEQDKPSEEELAFRFAEGAPIPEGVANILLQAVLPTVLKKLAQSSGAADQLPDALRQTLSATDQPEQMPLDPTIPAGPSGNGSGPAAPPAPTGE